MVSGAETLREAAAKIRKDQDAEENLGHIDQNTLDTWLAVADLLEYVADVKADSIMPEDEAMVRHAFTVARAYLGTDQ